MLRAAVILCLAVAALAAKIPTDNVPEQVIRFGSIGNIFVNVKGLLNPVTPVVARGVPAYEFVRTDGTPATDSDKYYFRCNVLKGFSVPSDSAPKPVLLCRTDLEVKSATPAEKLAFLFSAENLDSLGDFNDIDLHFSKSVWNSIVSDSTTTVKTSDTIPAHDIPKMRVRRQFGFGLSGSGAQASSSSFGGGGGFGGFPGGGFGGGFSGSQAAAGAGSFGGGIG